MGSKAFGRRAITSVVAVSLVFLGAGFGYAQGKFPSRPMASSVRGARAEGPMLWVGCWRF